MKYRALGVSMSVLCGVVTVACGDEIHPTKQPTPLIFDTHLPLAYESVRACRSPGEHSGLNAFSVWVSKDGVSEFTALWQTTPAIQRLPDGVVVVKEVYLGSVCDSGQIERWVAMKKEKGFDPEHADWHWQEVKANGQITSEGATPACIGCHQGGDAASCIGFGEQNGRDYTCTVPDAKPAL